MKIMNIIVHGVALTIFKFFQFFEIINPLCQKFQKHYQNSKNHI